VFRHEVVREALVAGTGAARKALIHREAAHRLASRRRHDPLVVAINARLGGNLELAAASLIEAASVASDRFDHNEAERLLTDSLHLFPLVAGHLARGRLRLSTENFAGAFDDAERASEMGARAPALELASWAAYYQRDFEKARELCRQAESALTDTDGALRLSVFALAGRISHADGDLEAARGSLVTAVAAAEPADRAGVAGVWLGWLQADQGEAEQAERLADRASSDPSLALHPFGAAHRALLVAYSCALQGRLAQALSYVDVVEHEVARRHLDHFVGRSSNYRAWLLRSLLAEAEADDFNIAAAELSAARGLREPQAQSALDLADGGLRRGELADAAAALGRAESLGSGYAFSWKAQLRLGLLSARLALADGRPEEAEAKAETIAIEAARIGVPRYATLANVVTIRARSAAGHPIDSGSIGRLVTDLDRFAAPEAWWITAELAQDLRVDQWWAAADQRVASIAGGAGGRAEHFKRQAGRQLDKMRSSRRSG
jgi:hypothetical protein